MSFHDRHYNREEPSRPFGAGMSNASVVTWLLGINCVVFLLDTVLIGSSRGAWLSPQHWGRFSVDQGVWGFQVWRWVTYQFLHADFFHLLFNMIALYFFGPLMERWWGSKRFVGYYLLCGVSGAVVYTAMSFVPGLLRADGQTVLIGASGSIFGILIGCAVLYPHQKVMLMFPPVPMTMRTLATIFLGIATLSVIAGSSNAGGEAAHLGGAGLGFLLIKNPHWLDFVQRVSIDSLRQHQASRRQGHEQKEQTEVNRILDKVRDKGLSSLTSREKQTLKRATDHQRRVG